MKSFREIAKIVDDSVAAKGLSDEDLASKSQGLDLEPDLFALLQERKSLAVATGAMTVEAGQELYGLLGESCDGFNKRATIGQKYVVLQLLQQLVS